MASSEHDEFQRVLGKDSHVNLKPKLGGLYERLVVVVRFCGNVEQDYAIIRSSNAPWMKLSVNDLGSDPLLLWDIVEDEKDPQILYYHFLWKGNHKVYATLDANEDFFKWFDVWWRLKENK